MQTFLFANTFFEEELASSIPLTPFDFLQKRSLHAQLQYLSYLVAEPHEIPLLSHPPDPAYVKHLKNLGLQTSSYALLSDFPSSPTSLSSWGPSKSLLKWALARNCSYNIPSWDLVKTLQSKEFCFRLFPQIEGSQIVSSLDELIFWWNSFKGPKVLKTLYGSSGRGHHISYDEDLAKALLFFKRHQATSPSLIAQPWVERILDFSTQWNIEENGSIAYVGATICENSSRGTYLKSTVGPEPFLFKDQIDFLHEHLSYGRKAMEKLQSLSFFGNVGLDAFIYKHPLTKQIRLLPIVEINARKTMGWVALKVAERLSTHQQLSICYRSDAGNLPKLLPSDKDSRPFLKQLVLELDPICI